MKRLSVSEKFFDVINVVFLVLVTLSFLFPVIFTLSVSISSPAELAVQSASIIPRGFSLDAYVLLLSDGRILRYYLNSIIYASLGTALMLLFTSMMAYPLTVTGFKGKNLITIMLVITMFFTGGLVPTYLVINKLKLIDTIWVMILPGTIAAWNVIIFRTFFMNIPNSLRESAHIDGAGNFRILFSIIIPLSKPLLATFTLFSAVTFWNDYLSALMYLRTPDKYPVQMLLRRMLVLIDFRDVRNMAIIGTLSNVSSRTVKYAAVIITIAPILCIYPFLQKYFTKGMFIGSIKG